MIGKIKRLAHVGFASIKTKFANTYMAIPNGVSVVVSCPDIQVRNTLIHVIETIGHIAPVATRENISVNQALYTPAISKLIINTPTEKMQRILGYHAVTLALETKDRVASAYIAKKIFNDAGYEATVHEHAEEEFPQGFIVFVTIPALNGVALLLWPRQEDVPLSVARSLPPTQPWKSKLRK